MDDSQKSKPQTSENTNFLPDVVHFQQIVGVNITVPVESEIDADQNIQSDDSLQKNVENTSITESISEQIPSKMEYSITESEYASNSHKTQNLSLEKDEKGSEISQVNIPLSSTSENPSKFSTSLPVDVNVMSEIMHISKESPVNLVLSSDVSKDGNANEVVFPIVHEGSVSSENQNPDEEPQNYIPSNDDICSDKSCKSEHSVDEEISFKSESSGSEEIIKLDIRGQGVPKLPAAQIIFGPPPDGSTFIDTNVAPIPVFQTLLSPFLVGGGKRVTVEQDSVEKDLREITPNVSGEVSPDKYSLLSGKSDQKELLLEEINVDNDIKEKDCDLDKEHTSCAHKSVAYDESTPFSTLTDYKTICEDYHVKLVHMEAAITQRDDLIEELTLSLQRSLQEKETLKVENDHLTNEVETLQNIVAEQSESDHDTMKAQLSDFIKYQSMIKDESTKFYSAVMSGGSSIQSSNGEKDMDREEITVNYSRSDLKSSGSSDDFYTGFETKVSEIINKFDKYIEGNLRMKLSESLIQVLVDEIGKIRMETDTELKEFESQIQQDRQEYVIETRRLRELVASVKAGNVDIDLLRDELNVKHEKEMENLRTYFEKKCSDMERSYSEEVWRERVCLSNATPEPDAGGDRTRRRTRSADLPSLTLQTSYLEQTPKQTSNKYEQQLEDLRSEHVRYINELSARHRETVASLEEQISQLKAHLQTAENTEGQVTVFPQDIDSELEKEEDARFERRLEDAKQQFIQHLQEQLQVLLSDPDAEVTGWPLELVALRDKIHGDRGTEAPGREEAAPGEPDKWKQRRNHSFDQNRRLEEITKERDGLRLVAASLHRAVSQLVGYCAAAEDELNTTVLARLLPDLLAPTQRTSLDESDVTSAADGLENSRRVSVGKRVHFAPTLGGVLSELDESAVLGFLREQRDLSADLKKELDLSLRRLRCEAQDLLLLASGLSNKEQQESAAIEPSELNIKEMVEELDSRSKHCDGCQMQQKNMQEAMSECLQRETLLRADLEAAMIKIATLMTCADPPPGDLVAEGYGLGAGETGKGWGPRARPLSESGSLSLDCASPRGGAARLQRECDTLQRERDDLHQQLESANRQLRSTRQFVEEQAAEREAERDEFARRLADLRDENARLATRLQSNARILNEMHSLRLTHCGCRAQHAHVEQLEAQTKEMNQIISELETRKASTDEELKATAEQIPILRDIIGNLEGQLEQKYAHETEILQQLEQMKKTIDERDSKMRGLLGELDSLRSERVEQSDVTCVRCAQEEDRCTEMLEKLKEQCVWLEERVHHRVQKLERVHEVCSAATSEPSEDCSLRDHRRLPPEATSPDGPNKSELIPELTGVWECLQSAARAEDAVLKRVADLEMQRAQLKDIAQEVRAERDVLQARMSEQALKVSSLSARLDQQRHSAHALAHHAASQLNVQLHDTQAEVQRLKEELESKDKQLLRLKQNLEEKSKDNDHSVYGNSCNPKDKVIILERELLVAQSRIARLEAIIRSLEADKQELDTKLREHQRALAEREDQLQELLALNLGDDNQKEEKSDVLEAVKISARTLSDIVSISEFDEQDLQMRKAELKAQNLSLSSAPYPSERREKRDLDTTLPPDVQRPNMSSLNIEYIDHYDVPTYTPRADSLPAHLTSTQNKDFLRLYKRNINETTITGTIDKFGESAKHSTALQIPDNCSMYPNREISATKNVSVEPKKINFSIEPTNDNKTNDEEEFTSLRELGITIDIKQENFPDILTQLKYEIKRSRLELDKCKAELKNAEEQLCEFPALKDEVEQLKSLLENTVATMENDKKFYENQLDGFTSNKKLLEQRLTELTQEVSEKSKDLHLLKEDILRRENMILELAKEKRNLTNKMTELEVKIGELQSKNDTLQKFENENLQMREKISELNKLEHLVSEKNQQIDSLNQHLDRLDDLQRCLNDKTEELDHLKVAFNEKSNELFQLQDTVQALNRELANTTEESNKLNINNNELNIKLTKLEKEQENVSIKLQNSESELERVNSLNNELKSKIEELKLLTDKLKDKETEIEILHEDINSFHDEIASLKEQLKMVSRSPSPRSKSGDERKSIDKQANSDKRQLAKIRKQISLLQHELDFNKKELNDKAFELAKAKLDVTELKSNLSETKKETNEKEIANNELQQTVNNLQIELSHLKAERQQLREKFETVISRIQEESNVSELKKKLHEKTEKCLQLEGEMQDLKDLVDRLRSCGGGPLETSERALVLSGVRSPTAELERAVRDQLNYSDRLDEDMMEQILSASSDDREDIPRLALNISKSSSSIHSTSSDRINRYKLENEKLQMHVNNLEERLKDKDALITELNRIRDKLVQDWQAARLKYEAERDHSGRLQLLLDSQKETAESLQNQDTNMIEILKKRLESAMQSELELQQAVQALRTRCAQLERQLVAGAGDAAQSQLQHELETNERLKSEISVLKSRVESERARCVETQASAERARLQHQRELDARRDQCTQLREQLHDHKRLKQETSVELCRARELLGVQSATIAELDNKLASVTANNTTNNKQKINIDDALTEIESHKRELAKEIATLKKCIQETHSPELSALRQERRQLADKVEQLERELREKGQHQHEDKEQAIRYLHGRSLRLESWRKSLVWQKRYLQRELAGYQHVERHLRPFGADVAPSPHAAHAVPPRRRFKCVVIAVVIVLRMGFLVRRRHHVRALAARVLLRQDRTDPMLCGGGAGTPHARTSGTPQARSLARRTLAHELRHNHTASPAYSEYMRSTPLSVNPPRDDPFILGSPRGEVAATYLNKLELVSRCLSQAMDSSRDVP